MTDSSPDINLNPGDRAPAGLPRAARRRTGSRGPGPGPTPGRQAQRLDTATDHLTSTLAIWAATCVQVIRPRARGSPGPLQALPDAAAPQLPGNGVALMTALLPSHVALGPVLHPSFQINYHFSLKILLKLLVLVS